MSGAFLLRIERITGAQRLPLAARHNKRELQSESGAFEYIDLGRSQLNYCLAGEITAQGIVDRYRNLLARSNVTAKRKDAVRAVEVLFSLPSTSEIDHRSYFEACTRWAARRFGPDNLLSSDVHLDESAPHCHVLFAPLIDGRMRGSEMIGGPGKLKGMLDDFHRDVATLYGLKKGEPKLTKASKRAAAQRVLQVLEERADSSLNSPLWSAIRDAIEHDPQPFASILGIKTQPPRAKSFVEIFTGTGRRTLEDRTRSASSRSKASNPSLCSVPNSADVVQAATQSAYSANSTANAAVVYAPVEFV